MMRVILKKSQIGRLLGLWLIESLNALNCKLMEVFFFFFLQISPLSTLESSFEALNVKRFDGNFMCYNNPFKKSVKYGLFFFWYF